MPTQVEEEEKEEALDYEVAPPRDGDAELPMDEGGGGDKGDGGGAVDIFKSYFKYSQGVTELERRHEHQRGW